MSISLQIFSSMRLAFSTSSVLITELGITTRLFSKVRMMVWRSVMSSTTPVMSLPIIFTRSPMRKGLKIVMKIPLTILANECCAAKPMMRASTPDPANSEIDTLRSGGINETASPVPRI